MCVHPQICSYAPIFLYGKQNPCLILLLLFLTLFFSVTQKGKKLEKDLSKNILQKESLMFKAPSTQDDSIRSLFLTHSLQLLPFPIPQIVAQQLPCRARYISCSQLFRDTVLLRLLYSSSQIKFCFLGPSLLLTFALSSSLSH